MTTPRFTVLGGQGFIGSRLTGYLRRAGHDCEAPARGADLRGRDLGHLIFCIGLTGDFRTRPLDAVDAHVSALASVMRTSRFASLVYLSSTRVYKRHTAPSAREGDELLSAPADFDDLYGLSKMMGESIALSTSARAHVVRLSNVYGDGFEQPGLLPSILKDALTAGRIVLQTAPESSRDYVSVSDAVDLITRIALGGSERIYNLASGMNVTNGALASAVSELTGCSVAVRPQAETVRFPRIDIERIRREFGARPASVLDALPALVESGAKHWSDRALD